MVVLPDLDSVHVDFGIRLVTEVNATVHLYRCVGVKQRAVLIVCPCIHTERDCAHLVFKSAHCKFLSVVFGHFLLIRRNYTAKAHLLATPRGVNLHLLLVFNLFVVIGVFGTIFSIINHAGVKVELPFSCLVVVKRVSADVHAKDFLFTCKKLLLGIFVKFSILHADVFNQLVKEAHLTCHTALFVVGDRRHNALV